MVNFYDIKNISPMEKIVQQTTMMFKVFILVHMTLVVDMWR